MRRIFLSAKLHNARVTQADINYEGSLGIDSELLEVAGILPNEQVQVYNVSNGQRFTTYAIEEAPGSRIICPNGACAHLCSPGDRIIICSYVELDQTEWPQHKPTVLLLDHDNLFSLKG